LMVKTFKERVRFETILVRIRGVEAFSGLGDPVVNLLIGAGSQSGY